jgi:hypothetical protein
MSDKEMKNMRTEDGRRKKTKSPQEEEEGFQIPMPPPKAVGTGPVDRTSLTGDDLRSKYVLT